MSICLRIAVLLLGIWGGERCSWAIDEPDADPSYRFWRAWVEKSGYYNIDEADYEGVSGLYSGEGLPKSCLRELDQVVDIWTDRIRAFHLVQTGLLDEAFTSEEISILSDLIETRKGAHVLVEFRPLSSYESEDGEDGEEASLETKTFQQALDSGLPQRLLDFVVRNQEDVEKSWSLLVDQLNSGFFSEISEVVEAYLPEAVFEGALESLNREGTLTLLTPPLPSVREYMERNGIREQQVLEVDSENPTSRIGDQVTVLVSYGNGAVEEQWLMRFTTVGKNAKERERIKAEVTRHVYTSIGGKHAFKSNFEAIQIDIIGSFTAKSSKSTEVEEVNRRILLKGDLLMLGLNGYANLFSRINQTRAEEGKRFPISMKSRQRAFDDEEIAKSKKIMQRYQITPEEERSYAGSLLALSEFYPIAYRLPELEEIMLKVAKWPSVFALATKSRSPTYSSVTEYFAHLPDLNRVKDTMIYSYPTKLNVYGNTSLYLRLFVTDPLPPLQVSAGIYGLVVSSPNKANKRLVLRILEGKRGPEFKAN